MPTRKTIPIEALKLGMYVVGLDCSWFRTPFLRHRWLLKREDDLHRLKACGIKEVTIDLALSRVATPLEREGAPPPVASLGATGTRPPLPHPPIGEQPGAAVQPDQDGVDTARQPPSATGPQLEQEVEVARKVRADALLAVEQIFRGIKTGAPLDTPALRNVVSTFLGQLAEHPAAMLTLIQLQQMRRLDTDLFSHAVDVCVLSLIVGRAQALDRDELEHLGIGALLHDVGETRLPQNILRKSGRYAEQDNVLLHLHPGIGLSMLSRAEPLSPVVGNVIAQHHERLDGSGYPAGLKGTAISVAAQIVGLVDVYDAMASRRSGRPPLSPAQSVRQLYQLGLKQQYDRTLVELLIQCLGVYPFGSLVELSTGERAVVYAVNPVERLRPSVKLILDAAGRPFPEPRLMDLADPQPGEIERTILRVLDATLEEVDVVKYCEAVPHEETARPGGLGLGGCNNPAAWN